MDLRNDKRQKARKTRDSSLAVPGEAQETRRRETESFPAFNEDESPADTDRIMEEIGEWENLKEAMWRVKANKGRAGDDGVNLGEIPDYCDLFALRGQLLSGGYKTQPGERGGKPKPDGGGRKRGHPHAPERFVPPA